MKKTWLSLFVILLFIYSCSKSSGGAGGGGGTNTVNCSAVSNKAFNADVLPIISSTCNVPGCHASGSTNGPGAITNHAQAFNARSQIRAAILSGAMPQGSTLTTAQKNSIVCWIDSGAPNN